MYLVRTGDDARELAFLLILTFDDSLDDGRVVGAQIDEAVGDSSLASISVDHFSRIIEENLGLTSQIASKKANDAVYNL